MPGARQRPLRLVCDTNIVVSGLLWRGAPRELLRLAADPEAVCMYTSPVLLSELSRVLAYPKFQKRLLQMGMDAAALRFEYLTQVTLIEPDIVPQIVPNDPDDDHVVAAALAAQADFIVSGDKDLVHMGLAAGVSVLRAVEAMALFD